MSEQYDHILEISRADAVAERQREISKVMRQVKDMQRELSNRIREGAVDEADAFNRNQRMPGSLGQLWFQFLDLSKDAKLFALSKAEFNGMAWQSLLQCSPYF